MRRGVQNGRLVGCNDSLGKIRNKVRRTPGCFPGSKGSVLSALAPPDSSWILLTYTPNKKIPPWTNLIQRGILSENRILPKLVSSGYMHTLLPDFERVRINLPMSCSSRELFSHPKMKPPGSTGNPGGLLWQTLEGELFLVLLHRLLPMAVAIRRLNRAKKPWNTQKTL